MTVVLYRVDERLIHGQVVIGWAAEVRPEHYVVVDDDLAESAWEQELYLLALPEDVGSEFLDVDSARRRLATLEEEDRRAVVLTRDVETMLRLARGGTMQGRVVNLGGIHHAEGRRQVRSYLHVGDAEREQIRELAGTGVTVNARDLPGSTRVPLDQLLEEE